MSKKNPWRLEGRSAGGVKWHLFGSYPDEDYAKRMLLHFKGLESHRDVELRLTLSK